jgi:hypothetical protein
MLAAEKRNSVGCEGAREVIAVVLVRRDFGSVFRLRAPSVGWERRPVGRERRRSVVWGLGTQDHAVDGCSLTCIFLQLKRGFRLLHRMERLWIGCLEEWGSRRPMKKASTRICIVLVCCLWTLYEEDTSLCGLGHTCFEGRARYICQPQ